MGISTSHQQPEVKSEVKPVVQKPVMVQSALNGRLSGPNLHERIATNCHSLVLLSLTNCASSVRMKDELSRINALYIYAFADCMDKHNPGRIETPAAN